MRAVSLFLFAMLASSAFVALGAPPTYQNKITTSFYKPTSNPNAGDTPSSSVAGSMVGVAVAAAAAAGFVLVVDPATRSHRPKIQMVFKNPKALSDLAGAPTARLLAVYADHKVRRIWEEERSVCLSYHPTPSPPLKFRSRFFLTTYPESSRSLARLASKS